jgi:hypothetical protein
LSRKLEERRMHSTKSNNEIISRENKKAFRKVSIGYLLSLAVR